MLKRRIVKCSWQISLNEEYGSRDGYTSKQVELLASYDTKEEAIEHMNDYYDRLIGTSYVLTTSYHEEIVSEEILA